MLLQVGVACGAWCFLHSLLVTRWWDGVLRRVLGPAHVLDRVGYVAFSTITFLALMLWIRTLPEHELWDWPGAWAIPRWVGLLLAALLFQQGGRAYDGRAFLGLSQLRAWLRGGEAAPPPFRQSGILAHIRHPWYTGSILLFLFCLPVTDVNAVWRAVFIVYTLVGTELEERKLLRELGDRYAEYRRRVPRYLPRLRKRHTGAGF